jgi:hypothetical protein
MRALLLPGLGLGIGCLILSGCQLGWGSGRSGGQAQTAIELWDAYGQARAAAQAEARDAQLVSASTQWQDADQGTLVTGADDWSFVFWSADTKHVLDVVVNAGSARVVNQTQVWVTPTVLTGEVWRQGPRDALLVFLAYDGRAFLSEHPGAVVGLHLSEEESEGPAWTITALDVSDQSLLALVVDASTMQVLSVSP